MSIKEKFTAAEWNSLKALPFQFFSFVALADGEVDDEEFEQLREQFRNAAFVKSIVHRELLLDILQHDDLMALLKANIGRTAAVKAAPGLKSLLTRKLGDADYSLFMSSLFYSAYETANASGVGNSGQGAKVSREEDFALDVLLGLYEIKWPPENIGTS